MKKGLIYTILAVGAIGGLTSFGMHSCSRDAYFKDAPENVSFSEPIEMSLPGSVRNAEKRKFADFTCDGIEDMAEVNDKGFIFQDYKVRIFPGYQDSETGLLRFSDDQNYVIDLPLEKGWFTDKLKIDAGDANGDGCADFIFTEMNFGHTAKGNEFGTKIALNQGDGKTYDVITETDVGGRHMDSLLKKLSRRNHSEYNSRTRFDMDWCDVDGNGTEDLMTFWEVDIDMSHNDLVVDVFFTERTNDKTKFKFSGYAGTLVENFTHNRSLSSLDTEDITGDGVCDLLIYNPILSNTTISSAVGSFNNNTGKLSYQIQQDYSGPGVNYQEVSLQKQDSFDANFDGCADYVHLGQKDINWEDRPMITYKLSKYEGCNDGKNTLPQSNEKLEEKINKTFRGGWNTFDSF